MVSLARAARAPPSLREPRTGRALPRPGGRPGLPVPPEPLSPDALAGLADPLDALPSGRDADGHDAKHGYGRIHALRACLSAADPVALELVAMGEIGAARAWLRARRGDERASSAYGRSLGCWVVRALLSDTSLEHALRTVLRHLRLLAADPRRATQHPEGALARQLALFVRQLQLGTVVPGPSSADRAQLTALLQRLRGGGGRGERPAMTDAYASTPVAAIEGAIVALISGVYTGPGFFDRETEFMLAGAPAAH